MLSEVLGKEIAQEAWKFCDKIWCFISISSKTPYFVDTRDFLLKFSGGQGVASALLPLFPAGAHAHARGVFLKTRSRTASLVCFGYWTPQYFIVVGIQ